VKELREKLKKYIVKHPITGEEKVILEVIRGKPYSKEGGIWIEIPLETLSKHITLVKALGTRDERIEEYKKRGLWKYISRWIREGLITRDDIL